MTLRDKAKADGRIVRWALTPDELDARGFHAAAEAARLAPARIRAL